MRHSHSPPYSASDYDHYFCLKPPWMLWVVILYLTRAFTLPVAAGIGSFAGVGPEALSLLRRLWHADILIPSVIASVVLYAVWRRVPTASRLVRWIWAHGQILLALSAVTDLALSLISLIRLGEVNDQVMLLLLGSAIDAYFLVYILSARRVRDAFSDFPPTEEART